MTNAWNAISFLMMTFCYLGLFIIVTQTDGLRAHAAKSDSVEPPGSFESRL